MAIIAITPGVCPWLMATVRRGSLAEVRFAGARYVKENESDFPRPNKGFAELLATLTDEAKRVPANAANDELSQTLRTAIATFVLQGDFLGKILATQAGSIYLTPD
jgi:hypothetical protein